MSEKACFYCANTHNFTTEECKCACHKRRWVTWKAIAWFKDGKSKEVEIPNLYWKEATPKQAVEYAQGVLQREGHELSRIDHWDVEEELL